MSGTVINPDCSNCKSTTNYCDMRLTWTCFLKDVAVADAATMANSKRTKVFIVVVVAVFQKILLLFAPLLKIQTQALPAS